MERWRDRGRWTAALWGALVAAPIAALIVLHRVPAWDPAWMNPTFHFYVVSGTSLLAAMACGGLAFASTSLRSTRLLFLVAAFLSIAAIFSVHGLATPGFIHDEPYPAVGVSAWLSVLAGAVWVAASAVEPHGAIARTLERHGRLVLAAVAAALGVYLFAALFIHESFWLSWIPVNDRRFQLSLTAVSLALLAFATWRYLEAYLFTRLPSQAAMALALGLLIDVQVCLAWGRLWHASWWLYHGLYAAAFVTLFGGWLAEARRAGSIAAIAEALAMRDSLAQLNRGRPTALVELADAIEAKDVATHGHVSRVGAYALATGRELGLPAWELRSLVLAAQMHDVGKIGTPDAILRKPGPLTDEEYAVIKRHASRGDEIAGRTPALRPLRDAIRHHHERWDGGGYPDGLAGEAIPLFARIIAVADTYDALTSPRPYRPALDHEAAVAELRRVRGTQLDPRCVDAFLRALERMGEATP
ncbi:MAG TPA: HD-GYP domain-containing protein, partial [Dehalococcoidia bacterium]|nr:HD-GYP domain-containing protein [Dehalococcoidia bacterium]